MTIVAASARYRTALCARRAARNFTIASCRADERHERAGVDRLTFVNVELGDRTCAGGPELVLHFHGFDDNQRLAGVHRVTLVDQHLYDLARHWRDDALRTAALHCLIFSARTAAAIERDGDGRGADADHHLSRRRIRGERHRIARRGTSGVLTPAGAALL